MRVVLLLLLATALVAFAPAAVGTEVRRCDVVEPPATAPDASDAATGPLAEAEVSLPAISAAEVVLRMAIEHVGLGAATLRVETTTLSDGATFEDAYVHDVLTNRGEVCARYVPTLPGVLVRLHARAESATALGLALDAWAS